MKEGITDIFTEEFPIGLYKLVILLVSSTRRETNFLRGEFSGYLKLLDMGCGYGRLSIPLALQGHEISGIDIVDYQIEQARHHARKKGSSIDFRVANMTELPYSDSLFDGAFSMLGTFQYLTNVNEQEMAIKESYRVLKPNGKLLISVDYKNLGRGLFRYDQEDLAGLVESAGFEQIEFSTMRLGFLLHKKLNLTAIKKDTKSGN